MVKTNKRSIYSPHPSVAYAQAILNNLPTKTGKSVEEWVALLRKAGPKGEKERQDWLKKEHKIGSTTAWMIAERAEGKGSEDTDSEAYLDAAVIYVQELYSGGKEQLVPIHDALIKLGQSLSKDVKICPCKTIVPFYRKNVFAQIKPATRTRIDLGLALKKSEKKLCGRLIDTGGLAKDDRITHRFALTSVDDIDDEVGAWLRHAYELDN